ncbi:MAG: hypothetical protein MZV70_54450 [Desulfobacterales bacterium]|nr:hypothetical protein [Desulfobacterales bacterium]
MTDDEAEEVKTILSTRRYANRPQLRTLPSRLLPSTQYMNRTPKGVAPVNEGRSKTLNYYGDPKVYRGMITMPRDWLKSYHLHEVGPHLAVPAGPRRAHPHRRREREAGRADFT